MNFAQLGLYRTMRGRLQQAVRRGRLAVIDIGSSKITCLVLKLDPVRLAEAVERDRLGTSLFGAVEIVGQRIIQSRGVRRGEIVDMEEAARAVRLALLSAEKMAAPRVERVDQALVSFSGGQPQSFATHAEVETETGQVTERDIANALAECPDPPIGPDRQVLHCQPVEVGLDYQTGITDPRGMTGRRLSVACHVLAVNARPLANVMECIRQCDLDLAGVVSAPYASGLAALVEDEQRTGAICIDMGGGTTSFSVFLRDHLIGVEQVRFGGNHVTSDIAAGLTVSQSIAERIKCQEGGVIPTGADDRVMIEAPERGEEDSPDRRRISRGMLIGVIRPRVEEILRGVRERMVALGLEDMPGSAVVLTGGACQLPGISEMTGRVLGRRPRIGRPLRMAGLAQQMIGPDYSTAVGLAVYALKPHDELWDFETPRPLSARGRASEMLRWLRTSW